MPWPAGRTRPPGMPILPAIPPNRSPTPPGFAGIWPPRPASRIPPMMRHFQMPLAATNCRQRVTHGSDDPRHCNHPRKSCIAKTGLVPSRVATVLQVRGWPVSRILSRELPPMDDHSSAAPVTRAVKLPTRALGLKRPCGGFLSDPCHARPLFGIAPGGACRAVPVARSAVGSYPTVSPSPRFAEGEPSLLSGQTLLCGAFPGVAPAGGYPAPLLHGVRTFLEGHPPRSSSHPHDR